MSPNWAAPYYTPYQLSFLHYPIQEMQYNYKEQPPHILVLLSDFYLLFSDSEFLFTHFDLLFSYYNWLFLHSDWFFSYSDLLFSHFALLFSLSDLLFFSHFDLLFSLLQSERNRIDHNNDESHFPGQAIHHSLMVLGSRVT